jgi:hypothetical protein
MQVIQANEVIMLVLSLGVLAFMFISYLELKSIPSFRFLIMAFSTFVLGWCMTVLEGLLWTATLHFVEHMCYATGAVITAVWFWRVFGKSEEAG